MTTTQEQKTSTASRSPHPVTLAMSSIVPRLSTLPVPPHQSKSLAPVFSVHNAIRRSVLCIPAYLAGLDAQTKTIKEIRDVANQCMEWVKWYMPHLHHHHEMEDVYW